MPWVHILKCSDGFYYTGSAIDLEHRLAEHQAGTYCGFTSCRRPVTPVFSQQTGTSDEAFRLEKQIKGWSRKKKEALIADVVAGKLDVREIAPNLPDKAEELELPAEPDAQLANETEQEDTSGVAE